MEELKYWSLILSIRPASIFCSGAAHTIYVVRKRFGLGSPMMELSFSESVALA